MDDRRLNIILAEGEEILELLPQRQPMVMLDRLHRCDEMQTVTSLTVRNDNVFIRDNHFMEPGLIESIAQTAAARTGWLLKMESGGKNKNVPVGVIGSIKNFRLFFYPETGSEILTTITVNHEVMNATVAHGEVMANDRKAAECEIQIFITEKSSKS
jgi:3-hydroxymyristoyl/3-hydroxydecanoyl-(acyl carrier protein) dehydratase